MPPGGWKYLCATAVVLAGCGGGGGGTTASVGTPRTVPAVALPQTPAVHGAPVVQGRVVFERSGCLACHQLLTEGNSGPGDSLVAVGARKSKAEIRRALVSPKAPMPSFRKLPRKQLDDLIAFLSALRGNPPGGPPCPDGVDCG